MSSDPSKSVAYDEIEIQLRELQDKDRLRTLRERAGVDFTSNDYLGLANPRNYGRRRPMPSPAACP